MSNAITPFEPQNIEQAMTLATTLAKSALIPKALQNKPADVLIVLMTGRELGLGPMQSLRGIHVVDGKGVCSADLMVGLAVSKPEVCEYFRLLESTDKRATYETKRKGSEPVTLSFTIEEAQKAGLTGKQNWKNYTPAMLRARAASGLSRAVYPDLLGGIYDTDEAEDFGHKSAPEPASAQALSRVEEVKGRILAPKQEAARALTAEQAQIVERVAVAVGAPTMKFGANKGKALAALSDADLSAAVDEAEGKLESEPSAQWAPSLKAAVAEVWSEIESRQAASNAVMAVQDEESVPF